VGGKPEASGTPQRWLRAEWPFMLACLLACLLLLRPDLHFFGAPCGSDWPTYLQNAAVFWHPDQVGMHYQEWRKPLHAMLVGLLGEPMGYVRAAQWIAMLATLLAVLGTGLLGRALGSRSTGAAAVLVMALVPSLEQSARWVNSYPLLAGLGAMALGLAAACLRWPRWQLGAMAALLAGLTAATDHRGLAVLAVVGVTIAAAAWVCRPRRAGLAILGAALIAVLATAAMDHGLQARTGHATRALTSQLSIQTEVSLGPHLPPEVHEACDRSLATVGADGAARAQCARQLLPHNWRDLVLSEALPPWGWLLLLPLALLPARWGRRSSVGVAVLLGGGLAAMLTGMGLVAYPERYALPQLACLVVLLPLAWHRLAERVTPSKRWCRVATGAAMLATAGLAVGVWPGLAPISRQPLDYCREAGVPQQGLHQGRTAVLAWAEANQEPGDLLLDCSGSYLRTLALPRAPALEVAPLDSELCATWATQPPPAEGSVHMLTMVHPGGQPVLAGTHPRDLQALGWRRVVLNELRNQGQGQLVLWRQPTP
jgi:hypothetical protein